MQKLWVLAGLLTLSACTKDKDSGVTTAAKTAAPVAAPVAEAAASVSEGVAVVAPSTAPVVATGDPLTAPVTFGPEGPVVIEPVVKLKSGEGNGDHALVRGWASDSSELAYWTESAGTGAHDCGFLKPGGKVELLNDFDAAQGSVDEAKRQAIQRRIEAKGFKSVAKTWPYASEIHLTWRAVGTTGESPTAVGILRVGAQLAGEAEPVLPIYIEAKGVLGMHPEAIALSPNGKYVGVVSHGVVGADVNKFDLRVISVTSLVGQTYNDTGFAHHKKGEFARSAELFHKAVAADPANKLAPYNYACALAKLKHPGTQAALIAAITAGGDKVKARAAKDADFADVKTEPWFGELVK